MLLKRFPGTFVEAEIGGHVIRFFVLNPADVIQQHHAAAEFYEPEELALMADGMTPATRYLDIGANIGNHVIYLCKFVGLRDVVVVEPNGPAIAVLQLNLLLNGIEDRVDTSLLGRGLSDRPGRAQMYSHEDNLGGAHFADDPAGPFELATGDELLGDRDFDFIKIDVEGMELQCLAGMERLIARCRPALFVEVDNANAVGFAAWCEAHRYVVRKRFRRYTMNENYLVDPV